MALVDLKSNLANFRAEFSHESKLKSPGNTPGSMPTDIQKKSPNNVPTQRYINEIKVDPVIKPKPSLVNPIKTQLKDKTSNIVNITSVVKDKKSTIAPLQSVLKDKTSQVDPLKTEVKYKASTIAPIKSEVKGKESKIVPINSVIKSKESAIKASAFSTPAISKQHHEVKPRYNKNVLEIDTFKIDAQLGLGSPFKYLKNGALTTKIFSKGYSDKQKYADSVKSIPGQSDKSLLYAKGMEQNSLSAIDAEYAKFNLQDDSFNPTYMKQPFVVRPVGKRWGFRDSPGAFDDGLISGGMTTAVERSALDTVRIAKWMASPKGLLWVVKQVGLGLTNPKVEAIGGALTRQTRIHSGLASLLSVPTTAFGIHFTRHGIPFVNDIASYENVIKAKQALSFNDPYSRLINLKKELFFDLPGIPGPGKFATSLIQKAGPLRKAAGFGSGTPILSLSGLAGPGSVYGIGLTTIKRHYNSRSLPNDEISAPKSEQTSKINPNSKKGPYASERAGYNSFAKEGATQSTQIESVLEKISGIFGTEYKAKEKPGKNYNTYQFKGKSEAGGEVSKESKELAERKTYSDKQYAGGLRATTNHDFDPNKDTNKNTSSNVDEFTSADPETKDSLKTSLTNATKDNLTPGAKNNGNGIPDKYIETNTAKVASYPNSPKTSINDYITLAYNKIPRMDGRTINDFRNNINEANPNLTDVQKGIVGINPDPKYYTTNNIQNKDGYGLGTPGKVGKDRSKPHIFLKKGNDFSFKSAGKRNVLTSDSTFEGDMITALDIGSGEPYPGTHKDFIKFFFEDATEGKNIMAFRATLNGFTDSFSPGWDAIAIMGRPDSAYLYSSFERSVSFNFTVAATTRSEMIPMWRKLNYLSTYTMPDLVGGSKPSGPMMRFTIGDLFHRTAGFISSLSYTIPDDATWDIAEDAKDQVAKQLPMIIDVSMGLTVIGDYRPQKMGRAYSLSPKGGTAVGPGNWIGDADIN